ncbi:MULTISPECIES: tripartite tricarboxylate transporter TctB family protein [Fictibacillus]|uniref:Tripartite tricarboxylate transporter TctB family protein n=1 Tax=Fictibacillus terranigra TaxID=3058424 RepID=A0ABT8E2T1_9BACL|nr:tripartite tricarboxylate transporter TctB family protein [Fictibacillus sp. CENA-BCM004]MDN4072214.1 tripartite tricarboxylate transporter TctB family protein [Fictibacillus sp. CENA-BCM004]
MSKTFDRYASLLFFVLGAAFMIESQRISHSSYGSNVGPNVFPFLLGLILGLLSIKLFIETLKYEAHNKGKEKLDYKSFVIILAASVLYAFLLEPLGYVLSTFLFLAVGFQTMERGRIVKTLIISALFSAGVYILFAEILKGTLPGLPVWLG